MRRARRRRNSLRHRRRRATCTSTPKSKSNLPPPGGSLPLGGSTGGLIGLTVSVTYQGQSIPDTWTGTLTNLTSATDAMPEPATPANVVSTFSVQSDGQDGTGQTYEAGFVHLVVTAPGGAFNAGNFAANFANVVWQLSDNGGIAWDSTPNTLAHNHIYANLEANTSPPRVDLYFPPVRSEAAVNGSTAPTMTLQVSVPNDPNVYVSPFAGAAWDLTQRTQPLNSTSPPAPPPPRSRRTNSDLANPAYGTIDLPAGQTIVITQPVAITHSVRIVGNEAAPLCCSTRATRPPGPPPPAALSTPVIPATTTSRSTWRTSQSSSPPGRRSVGAIPRARLNPCSGTRKTIGDLACGH